MTIYRIIDGVEHAFDLAACELTEAYDEKQKEYDREDVLSYLDCEGDFIMDARDISLEQLEALVPEIAELYRKRMNNNDYWYDTIGYTVDDILRDRELEQRTEG